MSVIAIHTTNAPILCKTRRYRTCRRSAVDSTVGHPKPLDWASRFSAKSAQFADEMHPQISPISQIFSTKVEEALFAAEGCSGRIRFMLAASEWGGCFTILTPGSIKTRQIRRIYRLREVCRPATPMH